MDSKQTKKKETRMGSSVSTDLTPSEQAVNDKIVKLSQEQGPRLAQHKHDMQERYRRQFIEEYSRFLARELHEDPSVVASTLIKNWKYAGIQPL